MPVFFPQPSGLWIVTSVIIIIIIIIIVRLTTTCPFDGFPRDILPLNFVDSFPVASPSSHRRPGGLGAQYEYFSAQVEVKKFDQTRSNWIESLKLGWEVSDDCLSRSRQSNRTMENHHNRYSMVQLFECCSFIQLFFLMNGDDFYGHFA